MQDVSAGILDGSREWNADEQPLLTVATSTAKRLVSTSNRVDLVDGVRIEITSA